MFSTIPMPKVEWNEKNMRYMMCAFPLVGIVIGGLWSCWFLLGIKTLFFRNRHFSSHIFALGLTLIPVLVSGGIHIDGFMDTCDALGSNADREKKLEILKDSHAGAFAVLACVIYFLSYFVLCHELCGYFYDSGEAYRLADFFPPASIFVLSRLLSALSIAVFPAAKSNGLAYIFSSSGAKKFTVIWCSSFFIMISVFLIYFFRSSGILLCSTSVIFFFFYYFMTKRSFGGITGDTAGWFVQMCEILCLLAHIIEKNFL